MIRPAAPTPSRRSPSTASSCRASARPRDARWDNSFKYKVAYGPVRIRRHVQVRRWQRRLQLYGNRHQLDLHAGIATPQKCFAPHNDADQINLGGSYGGFDVDAVVWLLPSGADDGRWQCAIERGAARRNSTFTSNLPARRRHLDRQQPQHAAGAALPNTAGARSGQITWDAIQVLRRLCPRKPAQSAG